MTGTTLCRKAAPWCAALACLSLPMWAQRAAAPLQSMPYSPSLDPASLDRTVDPCTDFYRFSCGGWMRNNPIPADQASWSVYAKLANDNQQFLWGVLADDAKAKDRTPVQQKVGDYFGACMDTAAIDAKGMEPLKPELARINGLTDRAAIEKELASIQHELPGSFFFNAGTGQDAIDSSTIIVELGAGGLGLPDRDYYLKTDAKSVEIREQYKAYVLEILKMTGETEEQAKEDATTVLRIETSLARHSLTRVERRDPHKTYHMMTVAELATLGADDRLAGVLPGAGRAGGRQAKCVATGVFEVGGPRADARVGGGAEGVPAVSPGDVGGTGVVASV